MLLSSFSLPLAFDPVFCILDFLVSVSAFRFLSLAPGTFWSDVCLAWEQWGWWLMEDTYGLTCCAGLKAVELSLLDLEARRSSAIWRNWWDAGGAGAGADSLWEREANMVLAVELGGFKYSSVDGSFLLDCLAMSKPVFTGWKIFSPSKCAERHSTRILHTLKEALKLSLEYHPKSRSLHHIWDCYMHRV